LKVYYWESSSWNQITGIVEYPNTITRINSYGICRVVIRDYEGTLFGVFETSGWNVRDHTPMKVEDESSNILFQGYLTKKQFSSNRLTLTIAGFAIALEWKNFNKDYILEEGLVKTVGYGGSNYKLELETHDSPPAAFTWDNDYWITGRDVGINIVDNTRTTTTTTWQCTSISCDPSGFWQEGTKDALDDIYDVAPDNVYFIEITGQNPWNASITPVMGGTVIPTTKKIHKIKISWRITFSAAESPVGYLYLTLKALEDSTWRTIGSFSSQGMDDYVAEWTDSKTLIGSDGFLKKYLTIDGANYDELKGLKLECTSKDLLSARTGYVKWDYCKIEVWSWDYEISPIMKGIDDNGASWIQDLDTDWTQSGVTGRGAEDGDIFQFGENTRQIVSDISALSGIPIYVIGDSERLETIVPMADKAPIGWDYKSGGTYYYENIDEAWASPDGNYIAATENDDGESADFRFTGHGITLESWEYVSKIKISVRCRCDPIDLDLFIDLNDNTGLIGQVDISPGSTTWTTRTATFDNLNMNQTDLDAGNFFIRFTADSIIGTEESIDVDTVKLELTIHELPQLTKYMARNFRGNHCNDALKSVCEIEGCYWIEDHANGRIVFCKHGFYVDSEVSLTQADYDWDWLYEDICNDVRRVDVWGNSAHEIHEWVEDLTSSSMIEKQIIDDTIISKSDAKELAQRQFDIWNIKKPSIKLALKGTYSDLRIGKLVNITMARPTVTSADYIIRMIDRRRFGDEIRTTIYVGLGFGEADEKIAHEINRALDTAHKALLDRLALKGTKSPYRN